MSAGGTDTTAVDREREFRTLLLHIAVSCPYDAGELSTRISRPQQAIHEDLTALMQEGSVHLHDGVLRTSAAARLVAESAGTELREVQEQVLAELRTGVAARPTTLIALAESGCAAEALIDLLIRATSTHPDEAGLAAALGMVARARGESDDTLMLRRATDAAARSRPDEVLALTEKLLDSPSSDTATQTSAALLAAAAHIQSNRLERALALYRHVGEERIGVDAAWAVVAAIGRGDLPAARQWREAMAQNGLTNRAAGLTDFADGLIASTEGFGDRALELLAGSVSTLASLGDEVLLPETPAAIAALVAFGRGEPAAAEIVLERALRLELGGEPGRRRHLLLIAWGLMMRGGLDAAERRIAELQDPRELCDRDLLLYWCLRGGLARRRSDLPAMREAWREIRRHSFGLQITLYDLIPFGEMLVLAARLRDSAHISRMLQAATELLATMGEPVLWSTPLHWHGVQAAFQAEDPAALIPYANALVRAGEASRYAATLAVAGGTWLDVLRGEVDFDSVAASARALAGSGHTWEASRLAGQAALQHPERESALSMMQLAREIIKDQGGSEGRTATSPSVLTAREVEVASLVLEGQGYRAIGEQLFISPKTVEHHIARIRTRIGASSRADLLEKLHDLLSERG